jgi:hypothetical protein
VGQDDAKVAPAPGLQFVGDRAHGIKGLSQGAWGRRFKDSQVFVSNSLADVADEILDDARRQLRL